MEPRNAIYDDVPAEYDALRQCWLNKRRVQFISALIDTLRLPASSRVLEVGSGTGAMLDQLGAAYPHLAFEGLEPLSAYVAFAKERCSAKNVCYHEGTAEGADRVVSEPVDLILSNDVLHHLRSEPEAMAALTQLSQKGCRWVLIEPNPLNLYAFLGQALKSGERNFRPRAFRSLAEEAGWTVRSRGTVFLIPPFVKEAPAWLRALERMLERVPFLGGGVWMELERR